MADIRRVKLPNGTTYNIKDNTARTNITKITNGTTPLPYGKSLSITNDLELNLLDPNNNILSTVYLPASGAKQVMATWDEPTTIGDACSKYERLVLPYGESLNVGDIVVASPAGFLGANYADLYALNNDNSGQCHFIVNIYGLMNGLLSDANYYSDLNFITVDREWTFVVVAETTAYDQDSNEYIKYILVPYSMSPILDNEYYIWSHTGRGLGPTDNTKNAADVAGQLLFSYGCGNITNAQPVELVDSNGNALTPDDAYLVIGANKEFTEVFKFNSGSNQVVGVKTYENNLTVPTSIYASGSMGLPKSVPLYYDPTTGTYKLTNNVDLTNDNWIWFFVHGQYIS